MRLRSKTELAALAALAYGPFLLSAPGRVSADSKQDLYLDPGRFLTRAADLWDPHVGAGTVPHQNLGYLFPVGPWFWLLDRLGVPDWVAQRLWLGTLSLAAVLGARWLFRQLGTGRWGALAGSLVYLLTPYQLAFTARISVLLLPWAALPWLVGLTMRATRDGGWRAPALLALVLLGAGGVNASSLVLVGLAPVLWVVGELLRDPQRRGVVLAATGRIALLGLGISAWWAVGLRVQGSYGLPVLQLTENVRTVAEASTPGDVLRGLGNWFFYGRDRVGWSVDQAEAYATDGLVVALSYAVPAVALAAGLLVRWAHRAYFAALVVAGTVVAVGAWPYGDPSPYGSLWRSFTSDTSVGLAFRNSPRVVPVVVLGLAGLLAAAVGAVPVGTGRRLAGAGVAVLALGALLPVAREGFLTDGMTRPGELPGYWQEAAAAIDAGGERTRVLELPGSAFAAYRWGTTVDPITPALTDRPYLAREVLPAGTPPSVNLLDALDRRFQLGTAEAASLSPLARLLAVGTVVVRGDLEQSGRFDTPPSAQVWAALHPLVDGLKEAGRFGPPGGDGADPDIPSVALFDVAGARPIVRAAPVSGPVLLAGDGDGIVDAAAAGLLDGRALVLEASALDDEALAGALDAGAHLVVTDSNRRRIQTWFYALRDTRGPTERAGETAFDPTGYDFRLDPFPGTGDASRTVVEQVGGRVEATGGPGPERPEDRGAHAVDGDLATAWRVGGPDPRGNALALVPEQPVRASELHLVQAPPLVEGGRRLARVAVTIDGGAPIEVALGPASLTPAGQAVTFPATEVHDVRVEVLETDPPAPTPGAVSGDRVGLAEVRLGDVVVAETVRPPVDLLHRVGGDLAAHGLDVVLTRLRIAVDDPTRSDDEARLDRRIELPVARTFALSGLVRPRAAAGADGEACRDDLVSVDGEAVQVRLAGVGAERALTACRPLALTPGSHRITAIAGSVTGLDVDRLVLSSGPDGAPAALGPRGTPASAVGDELTVTSSTSSHLAARITTDGEPFWLVLGESASAGWSASVEGASVGPRQLVDGYANGWLVTPDGPGPLAVDLRWGPQRLLWVGLAVSGVTLAGVLWLLWRTRSSGVGRAPGLRSAPVGVALRVPPLGGRAALGAALAVGAGSFVVATPAVAAVAAVLTLIAGLVPQGPLLLAVVAPLSLAVSRAGHRPSLAWLAVALLAAGVLHTRLGPRRVSAR